MMEKLVLFLILSIPLIIVSWKTLFNIKSHGFYRFLNWECILILFICNYPYWFIQPFSIRHIISWIFLFISIYLVLTAIYFIKKVGNPKQHRNEKNLYQFEKTTKLIEEGIYKYIRHPMYSSLLFLGWGIYLKHTSYILLAVVLLSTILIYLTAKYDEKECIEYFGKDYIKYMEQSKRFIPFLL